MSDRFRETGTGFQAMLFKRLFLDNVHRVGAEELLERLENETDFFTAPAGATHHGAFPGGLVDHSLNVYDRLREITIRDLKSQNTAEPMTRRPAQTCGTCPRPWTQRRGCGGCMRLICAPPISTKGAQTNDPAFV